MSKDTAGQKLLCENRAAFFHFEILESFEAGVVLVGTEVKSLRDHGGNLQEAYIRIEKGEAMLKLFYVSPYKFGNIHNHDERRDRKLLLHNHEIAYLYKAVTQKGYTLIPLKVYLKKGKVKVQIALAKGKKSHDKRSALKEREQTREIDRALKGGGA